MNQPVGQWDIYVAYNNHNDNTNKQNDWLL